MKSYLFVIIPAYNEEENFRAGVLNEPLEYLRKQKYSWELVFVDDGSTDDTFKLLSGLAGKNIRVLQIPHDGKAAAVTAGMLEAHGQLVLFTDFDQTTPLNQVESFIAAHKSGAGVVIGVRNQTQKDTLIRKIRSWGFITLVQLVALPCIQDSQCGFKSFTTTTARKIFSSLIISHSTGVVTGGYMGAFDVEVLYLARKFGFKIDQLPVNWIKYPSTRLNIWREPLQMAMDTIRIRIYDILGKYAQI